MGSSSTHKLINGSYQLEGPGSSYLTLEKGYWIIECWGASGGDSYQTHIDKSFHGGRGGYSIGVLFLEGKTSALLVAGGKGASNATGDRQHIPGGFNGGGDGYVGSNKYPVGCGGGSSDVRIHGGGISSRIIVAGGGGGAGATNTGVTFGQFGGDGGGFRGFDGDGYSDNYDDNGGKGGNQTHGGDAGIYNSATFGEPGSLLYGGEGSASSNTISSGGGGGGGYYGGGGSATVGGGRGSGYIGGVFSAFTIVSSTLSGNDTFYSPYYIQERGHLGNGYVKITPIGIRHPYTCKLDNHVLYSTLKLLLANILIINSVTQ